MFAEWPLILSSGLTGLGILLTIVVGILAYALIRRRLYRLVQTNRLAVPLQAVLQRGVRSTVVMLVLLVSLQQAGVSLSSLWAALIGLAALLAGGFVALSTVLSNTLCAVLLLVFTPFRMGDEIEILEVTGGHGLRGTVLNLGMLYTSLRKTADDGSPEGVVHVSNSLLCQKALRCWRVTTSA